MGNEVSWPSQAAAWWQAGATVLLLAAYESALLWLQRRHPQRLARTVNARLREEWFTAVSGHAGSEVLAVQTLRNSLMSATMIASTAALGLMGTVTLALPGLRLQLAAQGGAAFNVQLALELALIAALLGSLVASAMAVRYYNHTGFVCAIPVGTDARLRWNEAGRRYVRRAGLLYGWGLRQLIFVVPILVAILRPDAGPVAALAVVLALWSFDSHQGDQAAPPAGGG